MAGREETFHHTDEQVTDYVVRACNICEKLALEDDVTNLLLPTLVTLLASKSITVTQAMPINPALLGNLNLKR